MAQRQAASCSVGRQPSEAVWLDPASQSEGGAAAAPLALGRALATLRAVSSRAACLCSLLRCAALYCGALLSPWCCPPAAAIVCIDHIQDVLLHALPWW